MLDLPLAGKLWAVVFSLSLGTAFYVYLGYPLILWLLVRGRKLAVPAPQRDADLPTVTMLVAACNEEAVIAEKLENGLAIDYPPDRLDFVIAADGCTDRTPAILREREGPRIRALIRPERMGKINAIAAAMEHCKGEVILFSDANAFYEPSSVRKLIRHFQDREIGVVTGDVRLQSAGVTFSEGEGLYYRYERWLQVLESCFWSTVAIDGAMYAIRRELVRLPEYREVPDDMVIAMNGGLAGYRIIYDPEAIAHETATPSDSEEFRRKVRITSHGIQAWRKGVGVPSLTRLPKLWWAYVSHKLLRWLLPLFLAALLASNIALAFYGFFWMLVLAAHVAFYVCALAAHVSPSFDGVLFRVPYYFAMANAGMLLGIHRSLTHGERAAGIKTSRTVPLGGQVAGKAPD